MIESGGTRPNIITASAGLVYYIRSATLKEADELKARAIKCFEGAAIATGCTVEFEEYVCNSRFQSKIHIDLAQNQHIRRYTAQQANLLSLRASDGES